MPLNCVCVHTHVNGARTKYGVALGHAALTPEIVFHLVSLWLTKDTCAEAEDPETKDRTVYPCLTVYKTCLDEFDVDAIKFKSNLLLQLIAKYTTRDI